jgi:hypothetical protein
MGQDSRAGCRASKGLQGIGKAPHSFSSKVFLHYYKFYFLFFIWFLHFCKFFFF